MNIAEIAASAGPSVVGLRRGGSGIVVAQDRVLALASRLRGTEVEVVFGGEDHRPGTVLATDNDLDVALIDVPTGDAPALPWSDATADIGTPVAALADPGGSGLRATTGTVSARPLTLRGRRGRPLPGVIEHTAPLPRGAGGGPLLDAQGRVLGLNARRHDGGLILALPAAALKPRVEALLAGDAQTPRRLGVAVLSPRAARRLRGAVGLPERDGILVRAVEEDGPAGRAGVSRGDLIVGLDGQEIARIDDLYRALDGATDTAKLKVVRGTDEHELEVAL